MLLNCDIGEGFDQHDTEIMPFLDLANIACGGHAGNEKTIARTVKLATQFDVAIGAHPSYPDRENFGRLSLDIPLDTLASALHQQLTLIKFACDQHSVPLHHIKAHGALYNDSVHNRDIAELLLELANEFSCVLILPAHPALHFLEQLAAEKRIPVLQEGFADRAYNADVTLVGRDHPRALHHSIERIIEQALNLARNQRVETIDGRWLPLKIDTLCVHGDNTHAVASVKAIFKALRQQ